MKIVIIKKEAEKQTTIVNGGKNCGSACGSCGGGSCSGGGNCGKCGK